MVEHCYSSQTRVIPSKKRRRWVVVVLPILAAAATSAVVVTAFSPPQFTRQSYRRSYALGAASLNTLTVKELRQLVKETALLPRGVLSRLKKKEDLIHFLQQNGPEDAAIHSPIIENQTGVETESVATLQNQTTLDVEKQTSRRPLLRMPPLTSPVVVAEEDAVVNDLETLEDPAVPPRASPKDAIFEQVYERYPPVRNQPESEYSSPMDDVRQQFHPIFRSNSSCDMDLVFVGTASCTPGITRGVSCTALRLNWRRRASFLDPSTGRMEDMSSFQGGTWLFDVGECTQLQVQQSSSIKPSKITKIFLTHAHGDHSFGLPGLLCLMGQDRDRENTPPVEIYGPEGLRMWLRVAIRYSVSRIVPPYRVHEIMDVPMAPEWEFSQRARRYFYSGIPRGKGGTWGKKGLAGEDQLSWISQANLMQLEASPLYGEIEGGRSIYPIYDHPQSADGAPVWEVEDEEDVRVFAAPMSHGIPCLGYVVEELPRPGRLRSELVEPIVRRNVVALKEAGFNIPMKAMAVIKNLPPGSAFTFPDGTVVTQEDAVEAPRKGRKVVICGDTADSRALGGLAHEADVIVHEATNAYLQGVDKETNLKAVARDAVVHGHSTPQIAGDFCRTVKGKRLILNHFSARYKGDTSVDSLSIMMRIEMQAMKAAGLCETEVAAAWDLMVLPIHQN